MPVPQSPTTIVKVPPLDMCSTGAVQTDKWGLWFINDTVCELMAHSPDSFIYHTGELVSVEQLLCVSCLLFYKYYLI